IKIIRLLLLTGFVFAGSLKAQTTDEIIANHLKAIGSLDAWRAFSSIRYTGSSKWGNFDIPFVQVSMKDGSNRNDVTIQGLKMITAYDAKTGIGWSINPFQGSKDAQKMNEEEIQ